MKSLAACTNLFMHAASDPTRMPEHFALSVLAAVRFPLRSRKNKMTLQSRGKNK